MACPCSLSRTLRLVAPHALAGLDEATIAAIDAAKPGDPAFPVHMRLEEEFLGPLMSERDRRKLFAEHAWIAKQNADAAFVRAHGRWEEVAFAAIRERFGVG